MHSNSDICAWMCIGADAGEPAMWPTGAMKNQAESTIAKIRLPESLHRELRLLAAERRESVSAVARQMFRAALSNLAPRPEAPRPD
ncbi:MAG: hypothetical protein ABIR55_03870 [Burkholderiaceae bacterium]